MEKIIDVFKALSDVTRLRLCYLLTKTGKEVAVCELIDALQKNQYNVSKHLKVLKNAGIVTEKRKGRWILYCIIKTPVNNLSEMIKSIDEKVLKEDYKRLLKRLSLRNGTDIVSCQIAKNSMKK